MFVCVLPVAVAVCWCHWGPGRTAPPVLRRTEPSRGQTESACCSWTLPERWTSPCCPTHLDEDAQTHHYIADNGVAANSSSLLDWINKTREEHFTLRFRWSFTPPSLAHSATYSSMSSVSRIPLLFLQCVALHGFQMPPCGSHSLRELLQNLTPWSANLLLNFNHLS